MSPITDESEHIKLFMNDIANKYYSRYKIRIIKTTNSKADFIFSFEPILFIEHYGSPQTYFWNAFDAKRSFILFLTDFFSQYPEYIERIKIGNFNIIYRRIKIDPSLISDKERNNFNALSRSMHSSQDCLVPFPNKVFHKNITIQQLNIFDNFLLQMNKYELLFKENSSIFTNINRTYTHLFIFSGKSSFSFTVKEILIRENGIYFKKNLINSIEDIFKINKNEKNKKELKKIFSNKKATFKRKFQPSFYLLINDMFGRADFNNELFLDFILENKTRFVNFVSGHFSLRHNMNDNNVFISFDDITFFNITSFFTSNVHIENMNKKINY
jgi:hypothetical protein